MTGHYELHSCATNKTFVFYPFSSLLLFCLFLFESFNFTGCPFSPTLSPVLAFPQLLDEVSRVRKSILTFFLFLLLMYLPFLNKHFVLSLGWRQVYCIKDLPLHSDVTFLLPGFHHYQYFSPTMRKSKIYPNAFFPSVN